MFLINTDLNVSLTRNDAAKLGIFFGKAMHRQHFFSDSAIFSQVGMQNHVSATVSLGFGKGLKSRANFNSPTRVLHPAINPSIKRKSPPAFPSHKIHPPFNECLFHHLFIYSFAEDRFFIRQSPVFHHLSVMPKTAPKESISFPSQRKLFSWSEKYFFPVREIIFPRQGIFRGKTRSCPPCLLPHEN